jgi:hypothetical protein
MVLLDTVLASTEILSRRISRISQAGRESSPEDDERWRHHSSDWREMADNSIEEMHHIRPDQ